MKIIPDIKYRVLKSEDTEQTFNLIIKTAKEFMFPTFTKEAQVEFIERWEQIKSKLARKDYISFAAEHDDKIIGVVQGSVRDDCAKLGLLFVDKRYHRKGIGTELTNKIENRFKKKVDVVKLYSSIFALEFYQKAGYVKSTGLRSKNGFVYIPMKKVFT